MQKHKQQSDVCLEILSRIKHHLESQAKEGLLVSIDDDRSEPHRATESFAGHLNQSTIPTSAKGIELDKVKSQTLSESGKPVSDTPGSKVTGIDQPQNPTEGNDIEVDAIEEERPIPIEHRTVSAGSDMKNKDKEKQINKKTEHATIGVEKDNISEGKETENTTPGTAEVPESQPVGTHKTTALIGNISKTFSPLNTAYGHTTSDDGVFKKPNTPITNTSNRQTKQSSPINKPYVTQQTFPKKGASSNSKDYYSTSSIYPPESGNAYGSNAGTGYYSQISDASAPQMYYVCRYQTEYSPNDGYYVTTRETDYTLYRGAGEEKWTKLVRYRKDTQEPSIMDDLPYNLVPVSAPRYSYALPGSSESYSDIEKLLVR